MYVLPNGDDDALGLVPYSDFDCGAFSTWTGCDELVSDPESLVTN